MPLRIMHTSDVHIGMTFRHYPDEIREQLVEARFAVLEKIVAQAEVHQCHLLVVAGDLFEKQSISKKDLLRVKQILATFSSGTVCVLPGNHDYINDSTTLWHTFGQDLPDNLLVLDQEVKVTLAEGEYTISLYPAPCHSKHSNTHNLSWLEGIPIEDSDRAAGHFHIGVAHGALAGISPDLAGQYYNMTLETLEKLPQDLWLLGHTHLPYPGEPNPKNASIYNAGAPEPDGMDCQHEGAVWLVEIDETRHIEAHRVITGIFRFRDVVEEVKHEADFQRIIDKYAGGEREHMAQKTLLRLKLQGYLEEEAYEARHAFYREMEKHLACLIQDDADLKVRFTEDKIIKAFTEGSLPALLLKELVTQHDEETAHLAYELIQEVKGHDH